MSKRRSHFRPILSGTCAECCEERSGESLLPLLSSDALAEVIRHGCSRCAFYRARHMPHLASLRPARYSLAQRELEASWAESAEPPLTCQRLSLLYRNDHWPTKSPPNVGESIHPVLARIEQHRDD